MRYLVALLTCLMLAGPAVASNLPTLQLPVRDSSGLPISGGKAYFYEAGTSTPKNTYSDEARQSANANPVVADSNGYFGEIYLIPDEAYKITITNAAGTTLYSVDDIYANQLTSDSLVTRVGQIASNPLSEGAVGDGAADESTEVQAAIDGATEVVDLLGKTYRCDSSIDISGGLKIINGTLDFSNSTDTNYITITGSKTTANNLLTGNASYQDTTIDVTSVSGYAAGDLLNLTATNDYIDDEEVGEIVEIDSISSLTLTLSRPIDNDYTTANGAEVEELTPVDDVTLERVTIVASKSASASTPVLLKVQGARRLRIIDCHFSGIKAYGIQLLGAKDVVIDRSTFTDGDATSSGVHFGNASEDIIIRNSTFSRLQYAVGDDTAVTSTVCAEGQRRDITLEHNRFYQNTIPVLIDQETIGFYARHNTFTSSLSAAYCITAKGQNIEYQYNTVDEAGGLGFSLQPHVPNLSGRGYYVSVVGNTIRAASNPISYSSQGITGGSGTLDLIRYANNQAEGTNGIAVNFSGDSTNPDITTVEITGNTTDDEIDLYGTDANTVISNLLISDNKALEVVINGTTDNVTNAVISHNFVGGTGAVIPIDVDDVASVMVSHNYIVGDTSTTTHGMDFTACTSGQIIGNNVSSIKSASAAGGIVVTSGEINLVANNYVDVSGNSGIALWFAGNSPDDLTITGNHLLGEDEAISINTPDTGATGLVISGNYLYSLGGSDPVVEILDYYDAVTISGNTFERGDDNGKCLDMDGAAAGGMDGVTIVGNTFKRGNYAIDVDQHDEMIQIGNVFMDQSTGDITATNPTTIGNLDAHGDTGQFIAQDGDGVDYMDADKVELTATAGSLGATCTKGEWGFDSDATAEMCYCYATNTWYCWTVDDTTGPAD